ncbi:hypothetical protein EYF80_036586 [Liparis tanakae]|uniref:Uncharacterized protein n=1 Tax=Liparis tanakae TaxID=230148 RepID=A0A4Z2GKB4_9TELE|nr:hypothetical protein EYF80_036586 [Liparis tanakae]
MAILGLERNHAGPTVSRAKRSHDTGGTLSSATVARVPLNGSETVHLVRVEHNAGLTSTVAVAAGGVAAVALRYCGPGPVDQDGRQLSVGIRVASDSPSDATKVSTHAIRVATESWSRPRRSPATPSGDTPVSTSERALLL